MHKLIGQMVVMAELHLLMEQPYIEVVVVAVVNLLPRPVQPMVA